MFKYKGKLTIESREHKRNPQFYPESVIGMLGLDFINLSLSNKLNIRYGKLLLMTKQDEESIMNLFINRFPQLIEKKIFGANKNESFFGQLGKTSMMADKLVFGFIHYYYHKRHFPDDIAKIVFIFYAD